MQPPVVAFTRCEQLSIPLTDAEKEEDREMTMYIEMFSVAKSEHSQALVMQTQVEPTQVGQPTLPETAQDSNGSERTLSDDEEGDEEAQQRMIQAVIERLKNQLEVHPLPMQAKGKQKAEEVEGLNFEELAKEVLNQAKQNEMTLENEVQKQVNALCAGKKSWANQGVAEQTEEELWGHTSSANDQGIHQTPFLESTHNLNFSVNFEQIFSEPLTTTNYTIFPLGGPSSSFRPLFSTIPTHPHGSKTIVTPLVVQPTIKPNPIESHSGTNQPTTKTLNPPPVGSPNVEEIPPPHSEHQPNQTEVRVFPPPESTPTNLTSSISTIAQVAQTTAAPIPRPRPQINQQERIVPDWDEVPHVFSMASDEQLQNVLEQALAETQSRWMRSLRTSRPRSNMSG